MGGLRRFTDISTKILPAMEKLGRKVDEFVKIGEVISWCMELEILQSESKQSNIFKDNSHMNNLM